MEEWRDVIGYEGSYQVSNLGRVRRVGKGLNVRNGRILKPRPTNDGYVAAKLCIKCKEKVVRIHILVAEAFIGKRQPRMQVNHKNGISDDNRPANLEWVTPSQNLQHSYDVLGRIPPRGETHGVAKLTDDAVREIRRLHLLHQGYHSYEYSYRDLASRFGVTSGLIGHIIRRTAWKHID